MTKTKRSGLSGKTLEQPHNGQDRVRCAVLGIIADKPTNPDTSTIQVTGYLGIFPINDRDSLRHFGKLTSASSARRSASQYGASLGNRLKGLRSKVKHRQRV